MILISGIRTEPPIVMVIEQLEQQEIPFVMLDQRAFADWDLDWAVAGGRIHGALTVGGRSYDLASFSGIYSRLMDDQLLPELDGEPADSPLRLRSRRQHESLVNWMDIAPGRVVNRYRAMGSNASKPYQAQLISHFGFHTPTTLVTNDPGRAREFVARHGRVIYKSVSGFRSIVSEVSESDLLRLEFIRSCPVQFQEYVAGFDVRVHTIGSCAFATRIDSPGTDYRYEAHGNDGTSLSPFGLPEDVAGRCRELAAGLGLDFAGIDLRFADDGSIYAFEVNPSPAYSYYEAHAGQPIALALARYLLGDV